MDQSIPRSDVIVAPNVVAHGFQWEKQEEVRTPNRTSALVRASRTDRSIRHLRVSQQLYHLFDVRVRHYYPITYVHAISLWSGSLCHT